MYEDYFDLPEPSTGDIVFEELKKILLGTIKEEIRIELEHLRKENEELRPYKEERDRMQRELATVKSNCTRRIEEAEQNTRNAALEKLFGECVIDAWKVGKEYISKPKCNNCDEKRKLHYTTPRGRAMTEDCECAESTVKYFPAPAIMARFKVHPKVPVCNQDNPNAYSRPVYRWYTTKYDTIEDGAEFVIDSDYEIGNYRFADRDSTPFEKLNEWNDIFTSKERCQAFCDYLQEKYENAKKPKSDAV